MPEFVLPHAHDDEPAEPGGARHGSGAEAVGREFLGAAVDIPWDSYLGEGAAERVADGSLELVRHSYPATAAADLLAASTATGQLLGDAATHERLAAVAVSIASIRHRPARMPHRPGDEPHAWWIAEERTLVWMPWGDIDEPPYGLSLLDSNEADAVMVIAPDACWTVYVSGIPRRGAKGGWAALPERLRGAVAERAAGCEASIQWRREGDTVTIRWRTKAGRLASATIEVNRLRRLDRHRP